MDARDERGKAVIWLQLALFAAGIVSIYKGTRRPSWRLTMFGSVLCLACFAIGVMA
jgi:hypothetical protein